MEIKAEVKPMLGPTNPETGNVKVLYKSEIDGYGLDSAQLAQMEAMGLPTNFEFGSLGGAGGSSRLRTKQQKKTFWCDVCKIELNSEDTMTSHVKGVKHMKRSLQVAQMNQGEVNDIIQIENPQPTRKKVPIRLQQKILESPHFIVGLNFVKEYIACSNSEMEPHYECHLCETQGQSNCMFQHLIGSTHRQNYANELYDNDPSKMSMSQMELEAMAQDYNENNPTIYDRIETKHSDDEYPWPSGLEPWLIENGGSGIIPDGARNNFGKTKPKDSQLMSNLKKETKPFVANAGFKAPEKFTLPDMANIKPPTSAEEAKRMFQLGKDMLFAAAEGVRLDPMARNLLAMTLSTMELKMSKAYSKLPRTFESSSSPSAKKIRSPSSGSSHSRSSYHAGDSDRSKRSRSKSRSFSDRSYDEEYCSRRERSNSYQSDDYDHYSRSKSRRSDREGSSSKRYRDDYDRRSRDYDRDRSSRRYDNKERGY